MFYCATLYVNIRGNIPISVSLVDRVFLGVKNAIMIIKIENIKNWTERVTVVNMKHERSCRKLCKLVVSEPSTAYRKKSTERLTKIG